MWGGGEGVGVRQKPPNHFVSGILSSLRPGKSADHFISRKQGQHHLRQSSSSVGYTGSSVPITYGWC